MTRILVQKQNEVGAERPLERTGFRRPLNAGFSVTWCAVREEGALPTIVVLQAGDVNIGAF